MCLKRISTKHAQGKIGTGSNSYRSKRLKSSKRAVWTYPKDMQKLLLIAQGPQTVMAEQDDVEEEVIAEADLDQAEVLQPSRQLCDDLQKMAEDLASMQVEDPNEYPFCNERRSRNSRSRRI